MNPKYIFTVLLLVLGYLFTPNKIFAQAENFTFGGSGVLHYNDEVRSIGGAPGQGEFDLHKIILKSGYQFNRRFSLKTKLKIEHLFSGPDNGEVIFLDQAFIDYNLKSDFGIRAGLYSVPLGGSKLKPSFGLETAPSDKYISYSWRELAAGVYGNFFERISYEAYIMSGLHAEEFSTKSGIFNARKSRFFSSIDNLAASIRFGYRFSSEWKLGTSAMISSLQSKNDFGDSLEGTNYKLIEGHAVYTYKAFSSRLVGIYSTITESDKINAETGSRLGSSQYGTLIEFGYDLFRLRKSAGTQQLVAYTRGEVFDTHLTTESIVDNPENERYEHTFGLVYKPLKSFEIEADYQLLRSRGDKNIQQLNIGIGYSF